MMRPMARFALLVLVACAIWASPVFAADSTSPSSPAPAGIAVDSDGNVYVTDYALDRVVKFGPDGTVLGQWGGSGNAVGQFSGPFGVAVDANNTVYVVDQLNNRVQRFATDGTALGAWGTAGAAAGDLRTPFGVAISSGRVYVADFGNDRVDVFGTDGSLLGMFGSRGTGDGQFQRPAGVAVTGDGTLYVTDHFNDRVEKFAGDGHFQAQIGTLNSASQFATSSTGTPTAIPSATASTPTVVATATVPATATAAIAATSSPTVIGSLVPTVSVSATPTLAAAAVAPATPDVQLQRPEGIAIAVDGNVWVADYGRDRVVKLSGEGRLLQAWGSHGTGAGEFVGPKGVAVDGSLGRIYVADTGNARIQWLAPDGTEATWPMPPVITTGS